MIRLPLIRTAAALAVLAALAGCTVPERLANVGKAPDLAPMGDVNAPPREPSLSMSAGRREALASHPNSLWRTGAKAFFRDLRADEVGDILTVLIKIDDRAAIANETTRNRSSGDEADLSKFLGFEGSLGAFLPDAVDPTKLTDFGSTHKHTGSGEVDRAEDIRLTIAALVVDVLPNGNLVIQGRQEVRVNFEVRELLIAGIVRPEDISSVNTINHSQIAEARISYGGRGQLTDVQQPRYGQQIYDILFPF